MSNGPYRAKTEGGHAKGHSNMCHHDGTDVIKEATRKTRRQNDKHACKEATLNLSDVE